MNRRQRLASIIDHPDFRDRRLVYFGTRGGDAAPLLDIPQFQSVVSLVAPLAAVSVSETCRETEIGERIDLDCYSVDRDPHPVVSTLRRALLVALGKRSALTAYRPCALLSSALFPRLDRVRYFGMFHETQACFEHKAWVGTELSARAKTLPWKTLPWEYFADNERELLCERLRDGRPLVLRANRTDGGSGVRLVRSTDELTANAPEHEDGFIGATDFLAGSIPLNLNACVFPGGEVSLHGLSLQLIGIPEATDRTFGYCGNDFAVAARLRDEPGLLDQIENMARETGRWLFEKGYLGVFGIDALAVEGQCYLTEVNPRFQGSSMHSARIDKLMDRSDLFLDQIAAFLGLGPPDRMSLRDLTRECPPYAHVVVHNVSGHALRLRGVATDRLPLPCDFVPAEGVSVEQGAILFDAVWRGQVTTDGMSVLPEALGQLGRLSRLVAGEVANPANATDSSLAEL